MTPAQRIIEKLGGHERVAELAGVHIVQVYKWTYPRERGGADGRIPTRHQQPLIDKARALGIDLTPSDFFEQREESAA